MGFLSDVLGGHADSYHQDPAQLQTSNYGPAIAQGLDNQTGSRAGQTALEKQLQDQASGGGPNLAADQLRLATDQNNASAASSIASARGLSPALQARMVLDEQAKNNQQMAGQSAVVRGQQQLAAQGLLGQTLQAQRGQDLGLFGAAGGLENAQNQTNVTNTLGTGQINAGVAGQNASTNAGMVGGLFNAVGSLGAMAASDERLKTDVHRLREEALPGVPAATFRYKGEPPGTEHKGVIAQDVEKKHPELVGREGGYRTVPASLMEYAGGGEVPSYVPAIPAMQVPSFQPQMPTDGARALSDSIGTLGGFAGKKKQGKTSPAAPLADAGVSEGEGASLASLGAVAAADGGEVPKAEPQGPLYEYLDALHGGAPPAAPAPAVVVPAQVPAPQTRPSIYANGGSIYANGGKVPALVSPQEIVVPKAVARDPEKTADYVASGSGKVPGKGKVPGDSPRNDFVSAKLEPGSVVIPRSISQGENAAEHAASFVASVLKRSGRRYATGGAVGQAQDLSAGGVVKHGAAAVRAMPPVGASTSRGVGLDETRRRIKRVPSGETGSAPRYADEE